jgi:hypothetical protein
VIATSRCPLCGAAFAGGVRMPARKAAIFHCIKAAGDVGVSSAEILNEIYIDGRMPQLSSIKAHVFQINDLLEETDLRIAGIDRRWVLTRVSIVSRRCGKMTAGSFRQSNSEV